MKASPIAHLGWKPGDAGIIRMTASEKFRSLLQEDDRYDPEAYSFVYEALDYTLKNFLERDTAQHVTGQELLDGVRRYGIEQFGCLVQSVFETWGVEYTDDFGEIVFNLVRHDLMGKQESDDLGDFHNLYDFRQVFDVLPVFYYSKENEEWRTHYVTRDQMAEMNR